MNSAEWEESPSSPTASDEPSGGAGAIPASPGGAGAIPASPERRPTGSAGRGERTASAPPQKRIKQTEWATVENWMQNLRSFKHNAEGVAWEQLGLSPVSTFNANCVEVQGVVEDPGIQVVSNNEYEIQYNKYASRGSKQRWTTLGRFKSPRNTLMVLDCNFRLLRTHFVHNHYTRWNNFQYDNSLLRALSKFFSGFFRHWGCKQKGGLTCDSGGWFPWDLVCAMLTNTLDEGYSMCYNAEIFHRVVFREGDHMGSLMLKALIPQGRNEKTRFQITVEVDGETGRIVKPHAVRAASGHSDFDFLDPIRVASVANNELLQTVPGMFHMTQHGRLASILQKGLLPGSDLTIGGRHDIHLSPFAPTDTRNTIMHNKMKHIRLSGECWCVVSIDVSKLAPGSLRYCRRTASSYVTSLSNQKLLMLFGSSRGLTELGGKSGSTNQGSKA